LNIIISWLKDKNNILVNILILIYITVLMFSQYSNEDIIYQIKFFAIVGFSLSSIALNMIYYIYRRNEVLLIETGSAEEMKVNIVINEKKYLYLNLDSVLPMQEETTKSMYVDDTYNIALTKTSLIYTVLSSIFVIFISLKILV